MPRTNWYAKLHENIQLPPGVVWDPYSIGILHHVTRLPDPLHFGCWLWTGVPTKQVFIPHLDRRMQLNRYLFEITHHQVPSGIRLHNKCGKSLCVNPWHWEGPVPTPAPPPVLNAFKEPEEEDTSWILDEVDQWVMVLNLKTWEQLRKKADDFRLTDEELRHAIAHHNFTLKTTQAHNNPHFTAYRLTPSGEAVAHAAHQLKAYAPRFPAFRRL